MSSFPNFDDRLNWLDKMAVADIEDGDKQVYLTLHSEMIFSTYGSFENIQKFYILNFKDEEVLIPSK